MARPLARRPLAASRAGLALVGAQALLFLGVGLWPSSWGPQTPTLREVGGVLFVAGGAGMVAAALHLGRALTPIPEPNGAGLSRRGVYALVRHPMYSAILVVVAGVALARGSGVVWAFVALLVLVFEVKTRREERYLHAAYEGYADYARVTGKFIPGVGRRPPAP